MSTNSRRFTLFSEGLEEVLAELWPTLAEAREELLKAQEKGEDINKTLKGVLHT